MTIINQLFWMIENYNKSKAIKVVKYFNIYGLAFTRITVNWWYSEKAKKGKDREEYHYSSANFKE